MGTLLDPRKNKAFENWRRRSIEKINKISDTYQLKPSLGEIYVIRFKESSGNVTVAYVVYEDEKYKDDVIVIGDHTLKKQLENDGIHIRSQLKTKAEKLTGKKIERIIKSDPNCAKVVL